MRIIIRQCTSYGNYTTHCIELDASGSLTIEVLRKRIEEKTRVATTRQVLKLSKKREGFVRLPAEGNLVELGVGDRALVFLEEMEDFSKKSEEQGKMSEEQLSRVAQMKTMSKFYNKLGLDTIHDCGEEEDEGDTPVVGPRGSSLRVRKSTLSGSSEEERRMERQRSLDEAGLETLITAVKSGSHEKVVSAMNGKSPEAIKDLVNAAGLNGWTALHYAVHCGRPTIVREVLERGADVNRKTDDGWTALTLGVNQKNQELVKLLVRSGAQIDTETSRGTAMSMARKSGASDLIELLMANGISDGQERQSVGNRGSDQRTNSTMSSFRPARPPIVRGEVHKAGDLVVTLNKRYLVLNPDEGTLVRYKKPSDYPLKPLEIVPLRDVTGVKRVGGSWFRKDGFTYFEFRWGSNTHTYGCKNEEVADTWVKQISAGVQFARHSEEILQIHAENSPIGDAEEEKYVSSLMMKTTEVLDLKDEEPPKRAKSQGKKSAPTPAAPSEEKKMAEEPRPKPQAHSVAQNPPKQQAASPTDSRAQSSPGSPTQRKDMREQIEEMNTTIDRELSNGGSHGVTLSTFEVIKVLGSGAFGKVYKVRHRDNGRIYAMKALRKRNLMLKGQLKYALTECKVLRDARSPFILSLYFAFQTPQNLYLVLDYCPGGDLALHLAQRVTFEEDEARFYIAELVLAIQALHDMDVIYRDLKPENILLSADGHIKLADFGLSKEGVADDKAAKSFCGSPAYLSPEMLKDKGVGKPADLCGIGAVLYEMLVGEPPYYADDIGKIYENIKNGELKLPSYLSEEARSLIQRLLSRDPNKRPGVKDRNELRNDPFFRGLDWELLSKKGIKPPEANIEDFMDGEEDEMEAKIVLNDADYDPQTSRINRVANFTFIRDAPTILEIQPDYIKTKP